MEYILKLIIYKFSFGYIFKMSPQNRIRYSVEKYVENILLIIKF